jgi:ABC-type transport system involved in multi-copper enzyme maturation permease subunit
VSDAPFGLNDVTPTTLDLTHAMLVVAAYIVVLIGASYLLFRTRDMTD